MDLFITPLPNDSGKGKRFLQYLPIFCAIALFLAACEGSRIDQEPFAVSLDADSAGIYNRTIERQTVFSEGTEGVETRLWASEQLFGDPVALDMDNRGRAFVAVTSRRRTSELDIRTYPDWVPHSMAWNRVDDRKNFLHRELTPGNSARYADRIPDYNGDGSHDWKDLTTEQEEIRVIRDADGDGVAEQAHRYARGFDTREITDVLAGVFHDDHTGDVYATVAPDVWRLRDGDGDGLADVREAISSGYRVHIGFGGHNLSGITRGPDGKIYWGIGDIGAHITDHEGKEWPYPDMGFIARANPDGSDFEVFAHGLRNTHEFDFDKFGNLISVDNDGDHAGESERIVHLIHGSDSGWRTNWQLGKYTDPKNNDYKVWMDEGYYRTRHEGQTAHILPPVAMYENGPAGFAYNPGTALDSRWQDAFFVTEYTGSSRSAVHAFKLRPNGASFELDETTVIQRGILGTSIDFGPDGALYVADWVEGWALNQQGRIWRMDTPGTADSELRRETARLLGEDFATLDEEALLGLLQHEDMRVRQKAQFELTERADAGYETLLEVVGQTAHQLARIHGIWGIGQFARRDSEHAEPLIGLLEDGDPEIRAQAARVLGDEKYEAAAEYLIPVLQDTAPRPRMYAAEALGKLEYGGAVQPVLKMLEDNDDEDLHLSQAGAIALSRIGEVEPLVALDGHSSMALQRAAVVALKRMGDPGVAQFLDNSDRHLVTDAARAISDDRFIEAALPDLALLLEDLPFGYEPLTRRSINANLYTGTPEAARRTAAFAASPDVPADMRVEAIRTLEVWSDPSIFDRVTGSHRGRIERDSSVVREAVRPAVASLLSDDAPGVKVATANMVSALRLRSGIPALAYLLENDESAEVRIAALRALSELGYRSIGSTIQAALEDEEPAVRMVALEMIPQLSLPVEQRVALLASVLEGGRVEEKQVVLSSLGSIDHSAARSVLEEELRNLMNGELDEEIELDLMLAVEQNGSDEMQALLQRYLGTRNPSEQLGEVLYGGDAVRGERVFYQENGAQCERCHALDGSGGDVGPPLDRIGSQLTRRQILESLVNPGTRIAPGYGSVAVTLHDGSTVYGIIRDESASSVRLQTAEGEMREIERTEIESTQNAPSAMPPVGDMLSRSQIRDLVEFLATRQ